MSTKQISTRKRGQMRGAKVRLGPIPTAQPILNQRGKALQPFGALVEYRIGLSEDARRDNTEQLNQILADTMMIRDLYKQAHWHVSGATFYQLHLLFQQHYEEQAAITDLVAERVQILGGVSLAVPQDAGQVTRVERARRDRLQVPELISRLLEAHRTIIVETREAARSADRNDDLGTNDLLMSEVLRPNEKQVWFLSEHLVAAPEVVAVGEP